MNEEKKVTIELDGISKDFIISKVPCIPAREIFSQYLTTAAPKVGDYAVNQSLMLKMMSYVKVVINEETNLPLSSETLVNQHVPNWEMLVMLEKEMIVYNCGFFQNGRISDTFEKLAQTFLSKISETLTDSLDLSSIVEKQATES